MCVCVYIYICIYIYIHIYATDAHINAEDVRKLLGRLVFSGLRLFRCCGLFSFRSRVYSGFDPLEYPLWLWTCAYFAASVFVLLYQ